ncbi:MAG: SGNH hydrolase domain-containing protein [Solirubrobacteraceae bacterium]
MGYPRRRHRSHPPALRGVLKWVAAACAILAATAAAAAQRYQFELSGQRCFGAAARDPQQPCRNPKLTFSVTPTPAQALITPSPTCLDVIRTPVLSICLFGPRSPVATRNFAIIGDSHAFHWKGAVQILARENQWRGASITHTSCPFTIGTPLLPGTLGADCVTRNRAIVAWFQTQPQINTVFVSEHVGARVADLPGQSPQEAEIAGYIGGWNALPPTVRHIIVIRDTPLNRSDTLDCVQTAVARHQRAGIVCAMPRQRALKPDAAVIAAKRLRSPRVHVVDLTPFFCDSRLCYPVVGGALVYRDIGHLTDVFSTSLGPYLRRGVNHFIPRSAQVRPYTR